MTLTSAYRIEALDARTGKDWETLNLRSTDGSFYHSVRWQQVLQDSFRCISRSFLIYKDDEPVALCPIFQTTVKGLRMLQCLPESDYRHVIFSEKAEPETYRLLVSHSVDVAHCNKMALTLITTANSQAMDATKHAVIELGMKVSDHPITGNMVLDLERYPPHIIWDKLFDSKVGQRKYIARFDREGYFIRETRSKKDMDLFYGGYNANMKFIGAPRYSLDHFHLLLDRFDNDEMRLTLLEKGDRVIGGLITFIFAQKSMMYLRYLAMDRNIPSSLHPPYFLYWEAVKHANDIGLRRVGFGTNVKDPQNRNYQIKQGFGCQYIDSYSAVVPMNMISRKMYSMYRKITDLKQGRRRSSEIICKR